MLSFAQIVAGGAHAPNVIQTPNGLDQVNINRPSGAGVSVNTYNQFDVQQRGAILNNSPVIVQTQQAGMINGNPNFAAGQSAKVIVNQVNSASASQFNGALEVAGQRANVILANPSGISVNGGTFVNTSRATLTTGTPNYAADGSVSGFNVTGGNIAISGAGLNASNVDQVDLLSRAVQANAAVYAKTNLNVVTGANSIDYNTLNVTPIAGDGPAPGVSIDVSNLGGMYANRIQLVGTELGVGISLKGITAAQSGDLVLTTAGKLVLAGQTNASGNIVANAQDIDNSGTTYAQQNVSLSASGSLTNSGMVAAQQNTTASAGSVSSSGTFAAGVNGDGSLAQSGNLTVSASDAIAATGGNVAGGNASVSGAAVNLAGATNSANGALALAANSGDLNLSGATTTAGGTLDARASGALTNDNGAISSGGAQTLTAGTLSNRSGQIVSGSTLTENVTGATNNQGGTMQAAGALASSSGSLENSGGTIASLNADGVSVTTTGLLNNGAGGSIGGNGQVSIQSGQIANAGSITAVQSLIARAAQTLFNSGTMAANGAVTLAAGTTLTNTSSLASGGLFTLSAATFDNSTGTTSADQLAIHATNLVNHSGSIAQSGTDATTVDVSGTFDNTGGTFQTNAADLSIGPAALLNDHGKLTNAGAGTLAITAGTLSNNDGTIATNGALTENVTGAASNVGGIMQSARALSGTFGAFENTGGRVTSLGTDGVSLSTTGLLNNGAGGSIGGNGAVALQGGQIANAGSITAVQTLIARAVQTLFNSGTMAANGAVTLAAGSTLTNTSSLASAALLSLSGATVNNSGGSATGSQFSLNATDFLNRGGSVMQTGTDATTANVSGTFDNTNGSFQTNAANLALGPAALLNDHGTLTNSGTGTFSIDTDALSNNDGLIATNGAIDLHAGDVSNRGGTFAAQTRAALTVASLDNSASGYIGANQVTITDTGALDNTDSTIQANGGLDVSAQTVKNDGGAIANGGTGATNVTASGAITNTNNGLMGGNGDVQIAGGSVDNTDGTVTGSGSTSVQSASTLVNRAGMIQGTGNTSATAQGAIDNTTGQIEADGANATMNVSGATLDNTDGRIANTGAGATAISASTITNSNAGGVAGAGTIGGNGDVQLDTQNLSNTNGAQVLSGHDLVLNIGQSADNTNGSLSGANNVTLNGPNAAFVNAGGSVHGNGAVQLDTANLDNTNGRIGNDTGSGGSIAIHTGTLANQGGAIGGDQDLSVDVNTLTGDGRIIAGNNGDIRMIDDYTLDGANLIQANNNLTFTTAGKFTNQATLGAVNALTVNAASVDNQAGADLNSTSTTVNATGAISNAGRIEGDSVTTNSASLSNIATIVGNTVTLNVGSIANTGTAAAIAAATAVSLYSRGDISNTGGATIFSLGDINIAGDATRDANGVLANRSNSVTNDQSTIEAEGNIEVATQTLTNTRPAPTVETVTTDVDTVHRTKRDKYMACTTTGSDGHSSCTQAVFDYGYRNPLNVTFDTSQIVTQTTGSNAADRMLVVNVNGQQRTIWYNSVTTSSDGTITVNYWDDYDPRINFDPATEYPGDNQAHHHYQRVEIARDTTTTTQQDQVAGPQAPQAQIMAGGNIVFANVGTLSNEYSAIGAGNAIQIGSTQADGDVASGNYGGTLVNNVGQTLYQYQRQDIVSTYAWNEDITRDVGTVVQPSIVLAPVAIGGTGGTIIANNLVQINATDINNTNVAAASSATGATGGTLGANTAVTPISGGSQQTVNGATGGTSVDAQSGNAAGAVSGGQPHVDAPQSVAGPTGSLNIALPSSGLYHFDTAPGASYLVETDPRLTTYATFISSDYMLKQLGLNPQDIEKRLGDGLYEMQMVRNQITQLTGRVYLQGYANNMDEYRALMDNGVNVSKEFSLEPGMALTAAQMDALTSDIVWMVNQTVTLPDGSTQQVLAPVVYLAHANANDLQPTGALIAADDVEIHATGDATNSGVIKGGTQTVISATNIVNRGGSIGSSTDNGTTVLSASNDIVNASGRISGNRVAVLAGHDIVNTTLVDNVGVSSSVGNSTVSQTLVGAQGAIVSTGDMVLGAGNDLTVHGAAIAAGGNAQIAVGHDLTVDSVESHASQSVTKDANNFTHAEATLNQTSSISTGGSLAMQSGNDMTFKGASVSAGTDLVAAAGGNLTATTVTNLASNQDVTRGDKTRSGEDRSYDEQAVGTTFSAGGSGTLIAASTDATKGDVALTGSSLTTGTGAANIGATGNVDINEAREEHDSYSSVQFSRGSFVHGSTTDEMQDSQANIAVGSTVSGDSVNIKSGNNLTIAGSTVAGTNDVNLGAVNDVRITTSQDTQNSSSYYNKHESGLGTGGGIGISVGSKTQTDTATTTTVTNNGSTVGSLNGSVNASAGKNLQITGSDIVAAQNISGTGQNVTIDSAVDTSQHGEMHEVRQSGFTLALKAPVIDAISNTVDQARSATRSQDDRAAALHGMAAASALYDADQAAGGLARDLASGATPQGKVELSYGSSDQKSTYTETGATNRGSNVVAGGTAAFAATGDGTPGSGNLTIAGSNVNANDVILAANNKVNLVSTTDIDSTRSTNDSHGMSIGVSVGTGGVGIDASASKSNGNGNTDTTTQNNTHVTAASTTTILSGGDTDMIGANVSGRQINMNVGGNLNIASVQDTQTSAAHQVSMGGGFAISTGGASGSFSSQHGDATGNYAGVNEQSGIQAGDGGYNLNVKGNTDLKGATIASTADSATNTLSTGTLTFSDIQNSSSYNAHSGGFSAGATMGDGGSNYATHGNTSGQNTGGGAPMLSQNDSGSDSATTRSAISAGTVSVTDAAHQTQDVSTLSRDTTNTNGTVAKLPDVNNLLDRQSDMMAAASAAGEAVSRRVGDFAQSKYDEAKANGDQAGMDAWKEGGIARAEMQAAGAAIVTGLAGGNAVGGAAGAAIASIAAGKLNELSGAIAGANPTGSADVNTALGNIVANAIATVAGGAIGGNAGAVSGYNVDRYNRQLHLDEKKVIHDLANDDTNKEHRLEAAGCALVHCAAEYAPGTADYAKYSALEQEGAGYTAEQAQLKNYNGTSFSTLGYGGMVRQTDGSSLFRYSDSDVQTDQRASQAAIGALRPGSIDYVTLQAGAGVGGSTTINLHNGNVYAGASVSASREAGAGIIFGMIPDSVGKPADQKEKDTDNLLQGQSVGGNGCLFGVCAGLNHAVGGSTAIEFGFGVGGVTKAPNPGGNGSWGYSDQVFIIPGVGNAKR